MPDPDLEAFTAALLEAIAKQQLGPGQDAIVIQMNALPSSWGPQAMIEVGRAINEAVADRPDVRHVRLAVPGRPFFDFPITPKN